MRTLINYLRSCFCNHDFELIKEVSIYQDNRAFRPHTIRHTYMCKKCGCVKKIKL